MPGVRSATPCLEDGCLRRLERGPKDVMNAHDSPTDRTTLLAEAEADHWAAELEEWCLVREKVLRMIDVAAAKEGRVIARQLRGLARHLRDTRKTEDDAMMSPLLEQLGTIHRRALSLIAKRGTDTPVPPPADVSE